MMEKVFNKKTDSFWLRAVLTLVFVCAYVLSEPTLNSVYFLYCTYRIQTLVVFANYAILICVYALFLITCIQKRKKFQSWPDFGILGPYLLIYLCFLAATLHSPETGSMARWWDCFLYSLIPLMTASVFFTSEEGMRYYIRTVSWIYLAAAVLNLVFFCFPQLYVGEAKEWREAFFLGVKNKCGWPLTMGMVFTLLNWKINGNRWQVAIYILLLLINIKIVMCITALMGTAILICWMVLPFVRKWFEKWDFLVFVGIIVVLFLCLMFFQKYTVSSEPVALFIEEVLQKKRNMSGRLPLWQMGVAIVLMHPFLGVGITTKQGFIHMANEYGEWLDFHAHNALLQTWYEGGLLTVAAALGMLIYGAREFRRCSDSSLAGVCKICIFMFLFMLLSEDMAYYMWYMVGFLLHVSIMLCHSRGALPREDGDR